MRNITVLFAFTLLVGCAIPAPINPEIDAVQVTDDQNATTGCKFILNIEAWSDRSISSLKRSEIGNAVYALKREAYRVGANLVLREDAAKDGTRWHIKGKAYLCPEQETAPLVK
jgi:hypothetical protein